MEIQFDRIIDLTLTLSDEMTGVDWDPANTLEKDGWNARMLHLYSHVGTHMDAPFHFGVGTQTIDDFEPDQFIVKARVIPIRDVKPGQLIHISDLGETEHLIQQGDSMLLKTGWNENLHLPIYRDGLPRISEELAHWIVEKRIKLLGIEQPSVADVNNLEEVTLIHKILFEGEVIIVEGLTNLSEIKKDQIWVMALPLKIKEGDGAPARVVAFE